MPGVEGVDRRRSEEDEEELEKKQPEEGSQFEEEEPKQQKVNDPDLYDYYEGDSDKEDEEDEEDDFTTDYTAVEACLWEDYASILPDEEKNGRKCLEVPLCHKDQHVSEFRGLPIFELFKVRLRLNHNFSTDPINGRLYGLIKTEPYDGKDENPFPISYYSVSKQTADSITLDSLNKTILLPVSDPKPTHPICYDHSLAINFAFKFEGKDIFKYGFPYENRQLFDDGCGNYTAKAAPMYLSASMSRPSRSYGPFIARKALGNAHEDPILMGVYYSVYFGAWATVDVKFLKKDVSSFSGFIVARPCIFFRRIHLLSIQPNDQKKGQLVQKSRSVELTRSIVAVPSYSSLVIAAVLYDQGGKLIVRGKTFFPALEKGDDSKIICYEGVEILKVSVQWKCKR